MVEKSPGLAQGTKDKTIKELVEASANINKKVVEFFSNEKKVEGVELSLLERIRLRSAQVKNNIEIVSNDEALIKGQPQIGKLHSLLSEDIPDILTYHDSIPSYSKNDYYERLVSLFGLASGLVYELVDVISSAKFAEVNKKFDSINKKYGAK